MRYPPFHEVRRTTERRLCSLRTFIERTKSKKRQSCYEHDVVVRLSGDAARTYIRSFQLMPASKVGEHSIRGAAASLFAKQQV